MPVVNTAGALEPLIRSATDSVLIAAPFIKVRTLKRVIAAVPPSVTEFVCVTRWLPADIAAGVCDIEIFELVRALKGGVLRVHPRLHGKFYRAGDSCLVGSANLTGPGLGWSTPSNVELLVQLPTDFEGVAAWESTLLRSSVKATEELRDSVIKEADRLREQGLVPSYHPDGGGEFDEEVPVSAWVPTCPAPEKLWFVYRGDSASMMTQNAWKAAHSDLLALGVPQGLPEKLFNEFVAGSLRQMPIVLQVDALASKGLTDASAHDLLVAASLAADGISVENIWMMLKRWLIFFLPETYRVEVGQEVLVKGQKLSR